MKNKIETMILTLLILFLPYMVYIDVAGTPVNISMADGLLVLVGLLFLFNIKQFFIERRWVYLLYFIGLLLSLLLSQWMSLRNDTVLSVGNSVMLMEMVKTIVVGAYFFSAFIFFRSEKSSRLICNTISISSIPVMVIGFSAYFYFLLGKDFPIEAFQISTSLRFLGTFEDPNLAALYFIFVFFVSLSNFQFSKNGVLRGLMIGISSLSLLAIVLTMSRGGLLALAVAMFVFVIWNRKFFSKESIFLVLPFIIFILLLINLDYTFQDGKVTNSIVNRIQSSLNSDLDDIDRVQLTKAAIQMGNDNFVVGVGKGSFPLNSYKYLGEDSKMVQNRYIPHNTLAGFYAQQGILGLLIFISLPGFLLYRMIRSKNKQHYYLIPLFVGLIVHSMSINVENARFIWVFFGLILASEIRNISVKAIPTFQFSRKTYILILASLLVVTLLLYVDVSRKWATPIYVYNGNAYEKQIKVPEQGDYLFSFDVQTDANRHQVNVYDGETLIEMKELEAARGVVRLPIHVEDDVRVTFRSHEEGWMRIHNAYLTRENQSIPIYNYMLLPAWAERLFHQQDWLIHLEKEPSFKDEVVIEENVLDNITILNSRVIRNSNLSHELEFDMKLEEPTSKNYQLYLLLDYASITDMLPAETQRNLRTYGFTLYPLTSSWEPGATYTVRRNALFSSEHFELYGRYRNREDQVYSQDSYFPIPYDVITEQQEIVPLGESQWIHIQYGKDQEGRIVMSYNGWVESMRMNMEPGSYEITFKAQGSFYEEFSKVRLRDSSLETVAGLTLDDTMKEYTVDYHTDYDQQGISFVLELINYESEKDVGNRRVILEDWVKVVRK